MPPVKCKHVALLGLWGCVLLQLVMFQQLVQQTSPRPSNRFRAPHKNGPNVING